MEKFSLEKAQAEAQELDKKIRSGEAHDYAEAEKMIEDHEQEPGIKSMGSLFEEITGVYPYKGEIPPGFKAGKFYRYGDEERPKNIIDIEQAENQKIAIEKINQELRSLFPQSGEFVEKFLKSAHEDVEGFDHRQALMDIGEKSGIGRNYFRDRVMQTHYTGPKTQQGETLYFIAALLNNAPVSHENIEQRIKEILKGKKILVIGDDFGTISEALNALGAEATGVEDSIISVKIAHSGALAEAGRPQNQVIQGDAWDIGNPNSLLYKKLQERGPFDMVYSHAVLNGGSGFPESQKSQTIGKEKFNLGLDQLITEDGIQFHTGCEDQYVYLERLFPLKWTEPSIRKRDPELNKPEHDETLNEFVAQLTPNYTYRDYHYNDISSAIDQSALIKGRVTSRIIPIAKKLRETLGMRQYD